MALYSLQRIVSCISRRPEILDACLQTVVTNVKLLGAVSVTTTVEQGDTSRQECLSYEILEQAFGSPFHIAQYLAASGFNAIEVTT